MESIIEFRTRKMQPHCRDSGPLEHIILPRKRNNSKEPHHGQATKPTNYIQTCNHHQRQPPCHQKEILIIRSFSIPCYVKVMPPTQHASRQPSLVKDLKKGLGQEWVNLTILDSSSPSQLRIHNEFILHEVLDLGFMSLSGIKHLIITFNLDGSKCDVVEDVPICDDFIKFLHTY